MANIRPTKTFDLKPYGFDGFISLAAPDYNRRYELQEAIALNCVKMDINGKGTTYPKTGWITLMQTLVFVDKAPFELNVPSFLSFVKMLDEENFGAGEAFVNDLTEATKDLTSRVSPFVKLGTQEKETSE